MRVDIELHVRLKIPDVTALTAKSALQRRLGHERTLLDLQRADFWRLSLEAPDEPAALMLARELAEKTNLFVNPNKHAYELAVAGKGAEAQGGPPYRVNVLVTSPEDPQGGGAREALQGRLGYGERVVQVASGVLWTLTIQAQSLEEAQRLAQAMTVTQRVDEGLLVNPHFQDFAITAG